MAWLCSALRIQEGDATPSICTFNLEWFVSSLLCFFVHSFICSMDVSLAPSVDQAWEVEYTESLLERSVRSSSNSRSAAPGPPLWLCLPSLALWGPCPPSGELCCLSQQQADPLLGPTDSTSYVACPGSGTEPRPSARRGTYPSCTVTMHIPTSKSVPLVWLPAHPGIISSPYVFCGLRHAQSGMNSVPKKGDMWGNTAKLLVTLWPLSLALANSVIRGPVCYLCVGSDFPRKGVLFPQLSPYLFLPYCPTFACPEPLIWPVPSPAPWPGPPHIESAVLLALCVQPSRVWPIRL